MDLLGKRVIVVGLGKSGAAAAKLCVAHGAHVVGTDRGQLEQVAPEVRELDIELRLGGHGEVDFTQADLIVVSPGVPRLEVLRQAEERGVEVIGELELATRFLTAPILLVGGTNGKSTTTTLLGEILAQSGARVFVGGNLGTPAAEAVFGICDYVVLEISSFQAERIPTLRPRVSVLLNVTEDHLDRYDSFEEYAKAKGNTFVNQGEGDSAIFLHGDPVCLAQASRGNGKRITFGRDGDYAINGRGVVEKSTGERFDLGESRLFGAPNLLNAAAAIAAARAVGVTGVAIAKGLARFEPLPHRMSLAGEVRGVRYYDDSKATNVGAAVTALLGLEEERAVLIAGGRDKQGSYAPLVSALREKGRAIVVLGEAKDALKRAIGDAIKLREADSLDEAVRIAAELAEAGDAVLLSPACSSFDMFKNYAERGERFQQAVFELQKGGT